MKLDKFKGAHFAKGKGKREDNLPPTSTWLRRSKAFIFKNCDIENLRNFPKKLQNLV